MGGRRRRRRSGARGDLRWQLRRLRCARRHDVHARRLRLRCRRRGHLEPDLVLRDRAAVLEVIRHAALSQIRRRPAPSRGSPAHGGEVAAVQGGPGQAPPAHHPRREGHPRQRPRVRADDHRPQPGRERRALRRLPRRRAPARVRQLAKRAPPLLGGGELPRRLPRRPQVRVMRTIDIVPTFEGWQAAARALLREGVAPGEVGWREASPGEAPTDRAHEAPTPGATRVPRQFLDLARQAAGAADPARWHVLYDVLWRLVRENRDLLNDTRDPQVRRLNALAAQTRREAHRAEADEALRLEQQGAGAASFVPAGASLAELLAAAARCTGCELYRRATQTVFGRGPAEARIVLVGEQPGDQEDLKGAPFVGPAGEVLDRALAEVGLDRARLYVTNAVKHFSFVERGKRRIHQTPRLSEIAACRPWMEAEVAALKPEVLVCLGATAARVIVGPDVRLLRDRGRFLRTRWSEKTIATLHPSAVLRGEDETQQARLYGMLVEDLKLVAGA